MKRIKNKLSTIKGKEYRPHYEEMKALLGDETHDKYHHTRLTVPSKLKPRTTVQQSDNDSLVSPDRDVRALQYDACSEYYSYGKGSFDFILCYCFRLRKFFLFLNYLVN